MIPRECWMKEFEKKMIGYKKGRIVLYGANFLSCEVVKEFPEFNFLGIFEYHTASGSYEGIKKLDEEEIVALRTDIIILTKQILGYLDEKEWLFDFCKKNQIRLFSIFGDDICQLLRNNNLKIRQDYQKDVTNLIDEISRHDIISFDIFDTLITRKMLNPEAVFDMTRDRAIQEGIELPDFVSYRRCAQLDSGLDNPNIGEIYDEFQRRYGIKTAERKILENFEIEIEKEVLVRRESMVDIFNLAVHMGKIVYLVSDMYLPKDIIEEILKGLEISGYSKLIISCDYRQLKLEGLLGTVKERFTEQQKMLHIGDSPVYDGLCAGMFGIDSFIIRTPKQLMNESCFGELLSATNTIKEKKILGLICAKLFNNPMRNVEKNSAYLEPERFSYVFLAPLLMSFMEWFVQKINQTGVENVLFAARDGYLIQKLYHMIRNKNPKLSIPSGIYFYTSRKSAMMVTADREDVINLLIQTSLSMAPEDILKLKFGLDQKVIKPYNAEIFNQNIAEYVWSHLEEIFKNTKKMKKNYFKYMKKCGLEMGAEYAFYDFVSGGTSQIALSRVVPFEIKGIYFMYTGDQENSQFASFLNQNEVVFTRLYKMFEFVMSSSEPSVKGFNEKGEPIFSAEYRTKESIELMEKFQRGIIEFCKDYLQIVKEDDTRLMPEIPKKILEKMREFYGEDLNRLLLQMHLIDDWNGTLQKISID